MVTMSSEKLIGCKSSKMASEEQSLLRVLVVAALPGTWSVGGGGGGDLRRRRGLKDSFTCKSTRRSESLIP